MFYWQLELDTNEDTKRKIKSKGLYPTAAEMLQPSKSVQSLSPSLLMSRVASLKGQTFPDGVPMTPIKKRDRTISENSSNYGQDRSRRGTVADGGIRSRRGTLSRLEDVAAGNRPLYRDDIFFTGSLHRLPDYRSSQKVCRWKHSIRWNLTPRCSWIA